MLNMAEYADIKRKKMKKVLNWLGKKEFITVEKGGKHQITVKYNYWERPFPIPFRHGVVNKYIVKALMQKLVDSEICAKEEFDKKIK